MQVKKFLYRLQNRIRNQLFGSLRQSLILVVIVMLFLGGAFYQIGREVPKIVEKALPKAKAAAPSTSWWDASYRVRRKITITTTDAIASGYAVSFSFAHNTAVSAGNSLSNGNDVRVVYWTGSSWTALDRLLDDNSAYNNATTTIWFKTQASIAASSSDDNYYVYYGNLSAVSPPANGDNIFFMYDTFPGSSITASKWTCTSCTVSGGNVTVATGGNTLRQTATYQTGVDYRYEGRGRMITNNSDADMFAASDPDAPTLDSGTDYVSFYRFSSESPPMRIENSTDGYNGSVGTNREFTGFTPATLTTLQNFYIDRLSTTSVRYIQNTTTIGTHTVSTAIPTGNLRIYVHTSTTAMLFAYIRIRPIVTTEPTQGVGSEELIETRQSNFRFFANANSTDVGSPLAAQNTAASTASLTTSFRLRMLVYAGSTITSGTGTMKLQVAARSGTCDTAFSGETYADVATGSGVIRYNNNASPADGVALTANAQDPTAGGATIQNQTYEESNNFNPSTTINATEYGKWDFSLRDVGGAANATYCFRLMYSSSSVLNYYDQIPQITLAATGTLTTDIVDAGGSSVGSPSVSMSTGTVSFSCGSTSATLGVSAQRIRVTNTTASAPWTLSIAATSGATSTWTTGAITFDFNDSTSSGCGDGGDADSRPGQLSISPSGGTITPQGGCSSTGVTLGSNTAFLQGTTDSITLATASGSAQTNCYWEFTDIALSQTIPAEQAAGTYTLSMTVTVVAS